MSRFPDLDENTKQESGHSLATRKSANGTGVHLFAGGDGQERDMTLRDHWQILRNRIWIILLTVGGFTLLVTAWLALSPDYYEGHARVEIGLENANPPISDTESRLPVDLDPAYFATQLQIMKSPMVLEQVAKALDLQNDTIYKRHMAVGGRKIRYLLRLAFLAKKDPLIETEQEGPLVTKALDSVATPEELKKSKELEPIVRDLQMRLTVEPVKEPSSVLKDTRLVSIVVKHPSPLLAAKLANAIADAVVFSNRARKLQAGKTSNVHLTGQINELQSKIREDEQELASYASKHNILSLDPSQNMAIERLTALNRQLVEAENARKEAESNYEQVLRSSAGGALAANAVHHAVPPEARATDRPTASHSIVGLAPGMDTPPVSAARTNSPSTSVTPADALAEQNAKQIGDLEIRLAELRQKRAQVLVGATEKWPEVQEIDGQIASVTNSLAAMQGRATSVLMAGLETKYRQELAHEASIRAAFESQRGVTRVQNQDAVEYRLLQQQIETEKNLLNGYLKRFNGNDVAQAAVTSNIRVVDYSTLPGRTDAAGPWRLLYVALAVIASLLFSICLVLFLEYWDDTIRSSDEVKQLMHLPALAVIPAGRSMRGHRRLQDAGLFLNGGAANSALLLDSKASPALVENYRRLRTAARFLMPEGCRTMLVTSALAGEGKTTTVANLAISLSQVQAPVLVIDGDMRKQKLSEVFRVGPLAGLQELLSSTADLNGKEVLDSLQRHEPSGLFVLPAGRKVPNCAELLGSPRMRSLLKILSARFRHVVIDSPAITSSVDTIILSKIVDCVLIVVESGKSSREVVLHSQAMLEDIGARLFGVVLNKAKAARPSTSYDYYSSSEVDLRSRVIETPQNILNSE